MAVTYQDSATVSLALGSCLLLSASTPVAVERALCHGVVMGLS